MSVHYETGDPALPVLCLATRDAVRLPFCVVVPELPGGGALLVSGTTLAVGAGSWRVSRWWAPPRPSGLTPPGILESPGPAVPGVTLPSPSYDGLDAAALVGAGPGLTPAGDDVLAGALVAAHAVCDPRLGGWQDATRRAMAARTTTAVSRGMLHAALEGYATPELADYLLALCTRRPTGPARERLLGLGSSSGAALLAGVRHTLTTTPAGRGAA